jgi:hypothetical protein
MQQLHLTDGACQFVTARRDSERDQRGRGHCVSAGAEPTALISELGRSELWPFMARLSEHKHCIYNGMEPPSLSALPCPRVSPCTRKASEWRPPQSPRKHGNRWDCVWTSIHQGPTVSQDCVAWPNLDQNPSMRAAFLGRMRPA